MAIGGSLATHSCGGSPGIGSTEVPVAPHRCSLFIRRETEPLRTRESAVIVTKESTLSIAECRSAPSLGNFGFERPIGGCEKMLGGRGDIGLSPAIYEPFGGCDTRDLHDREKRVLRDLRAHGDPTSPTRG